MSGKKKKGRKQQRCVWILNRNERLAWEEEERKRAGKVELEHACMQNMYFKPQPFVATSRPQGGSFIGPFRKPFRLDNDVILNKKEYVLHFVYIYMTKVDF
jgi:hypothetical protein